MDSNLYVNEFVEKLSTLNVPQSDIYNYLNYSVKIENVFDYETKISLFERMISDFENKYPNLFIDLKDEIDFLYNVIVNPGC